MTYPTHFLATFLGISMLASTAQAQKICQGFGPQTPRDISSPDGTNTISFPSAGPVSAMNLCNIHLHAQAEHKGPGFAFFAGANEHGGYQCNQSAQLTEAELSDPGEGAFKGVKPGDSIEVHWVYSSCDITPGKGLASCLSETCSNPSLRVESQVFLVVNDPKALDFADFAYDGTIIDGRHQARSLPEGTGDPVVFLGSTTGPSYNEETCSPFQVTWSVRPQCAKIDIASLHQWAEKGNVFEEDNAHGVRQLVVAPELLAPF